MFHISCRSAVSAAVVTALALLLSACNRIPDTIKIGVAQPLSGSNATQGKDIANGIQLAVNEINKKGFVVDGKKITLETVVMDDKGDAEEGKKVANSLVDAGVVALIGHLNSNISIATAPIYAAKGIAQLSMSSSAKFTQLGHATALRLIGNDDLQARAWACMQPRRFKVINLRCWTMVLNFAKQRPSKLPSN